MDEQVNGRVQPEEGAAAEETRREEIRRRNAFVRALDRALTDLRQRSYEGKLTTPQRWKKLAFAPAGMEPAAFEEAALAYIEEHEHAEDTPALGEPPAPAPLDVILEGRELTEDDPLPEPVVTDIVMLFGKKAVYLYSKPLLSHSFAHALFMTAEDDDLSTLVDMVRTESRVYPRPVSVDDFMNPPYLWPTGKTLAVYQRVAEDGAFKDIGQVQASNGKIYLYSGLYLSEVQAKSLAEWYEVERPLNP